jgi:cytochrome bd-type quinol oxidase subunit 1
MFYALVLIVHSWLRWVVLVAGVASVARAVLGVATRRAWTPLDQKLGTVFVAALDVQVLLGLLLYFVLSPVTPKSLADFKAYMPVAPLRFFAIEHAFGMLLALVIAHIGWRRLKRMKTDRGRLMCVLLALGIALVLVAGSIPWPWAPYGRPLFRTL